MDFPAPFGPISTRISPFLTFNLSLIHLDKELIDYVIVHELTHFLQANHSTLFYQEIAKRMPDYKERLKRLKEKHV